MAAPDVLYSSTPRVTENPKKLDGVDFQIDCLMGLINRMGKTVERTGERLLEVLLPVASLPVSNQTTPSTPTGPRCLLEMRLEALYNELEQHQSTLNSINSRCRLV
jgi:hypothetical protein